MERPNSILGLAVHAARLRWQALSPRMRMVAIAAATFGTLAAGTAAVHVATCSSSCCSGCPSQAAAHGCPHAAAAAHGDCPHSH